MEKFCLFFDMYFGFSLIKQVVFRFIFIWSLEKILLDYIARSEFLELADEVLEPKTSSSLVGLIKLNSPSNIG